MKKIDLTDEALRKAAGIIYHWIRREKSVEEAVARARRREPQLTDAEIATAMEWAQRTLNLDVLLSVADPDATLGDLMDAAGLP